MYQGINSTEATSELSALGRLCWFLFSAIDNVRMFRVSQLITVLTLAMLLAGIGSTILIFRSVMTISTVWHDYDYGLARRIDLYSQMQSALGYGGGESLLGASNCG